MKKLMNTYFGRCGDNWVAEYVEIYFVQSGDTTQHDASCSRMLQPT
jgi:hypothetical protein